MERRLDLLPMNTPTHIPTYDDVVLPSRPSPAHDIEPMVDAPASAERLVVSGYAVPPADRALERLGEARIAELRSRLETGAYNSPDVMTELAMRMLESGDL